MKELHLYSDTSAGLATVSRRGFGRLRHLDIKQLWLQEEVRLGRLRVHHTSSENNVSDLLTKPLSSQTFAHLKQVLGLRAPLIEGEQSDTVAMLSQHPPPTCACSEVVWIHVATSGFATWRCPRCRNEIHWVDYLRVQADLLLRRDEGGEATYTTGMFAPSPYVDEPVAEPHPATSTRPFATSSSSRLRSPPPVQSAPTRRQVDYIAMLTGRLGLDAEAELCAVRTKAQTSTNIDEFLARLTQRRQQAHPPPTRG